MSFLRTMREWVGFNPLDFFINFTLKQYVVTFFHEYWHLATAQLLGGDGFITVQGLIAFWTNIVDQPPVPEVYLIAFMGGLGTATLCGIFWMFDSDIEDKLIWAAVGHSQFWYGIVEGLLFYYQRMDLIWELGFAALIIPVIYILATSKEMWDKP